MLLKLTKQNDHRGRPILENQEPHTFWWGPHCPITMPAFQKTNLGTIPWFLSWFMAPLEMRECAAFHDWMTNEFAPPGEESGFTRWAADVVLYEHMRSRGFSRFKSHIIFYGVRIAAISKGLE